MKLRPTFSVKVKLWLHSDVCIWAPSSWSQRTLSVYVWVPSGTLVKQQGSHKSIWGTKGPSIKALVHQEHEVSNPLANQSFNNEFTLRNIPEERRSSPTPRRKPAITQRKLAFYFLSCRRFFKMLNARQVFREFLQIFRYFMFEFPCIITLHYIKN
jgi:hypothetical protein